MDSTSFIQGRCQAFHIVQKLCIRIFPGYASKYRQSFSFLHIIHKMARWVFPLHSGYPPMLRIRSIRRTTSIRASRISIPSLNARLIRLADFAVKGFLPFLLCLGASCLCGAFLDMRCPPFQGCRFLNSLVPEERKVQARQPIWRFLRARSRRAR